MKTIQKNRGQATVEIMVILPMLLIILAVSISIFAQQLLISDSIRIQQSAERSVEFVASALTGMSRAPVGSSVRFFIPSGIEPQTIQLANGLLEARSSRGYASTLLPYSEWSTPPLSDGNFFRVQKDINGSLHVQVV